MALDLPLPKTIFVHNWITMKDGKMSKSVGNVIYPDQLMERYGLDATKYYLVRVVPTSSDGMFTPEDFVELFNSDLCNDLGNLLNRSIAMCNKYFDGKVDGYNGIKNDADLSLEELSKTTIKEFEKSIERFELANSLKVIWKLISRTNKYIDETEPWKLSKNIESDEDREKLKSVIYHLIATLREIAILIRPLMQETSDKMLKQLGIANDGISWNDLNSYKELSAIKVIEKGEPLFQRLDAKEEVDYIKGLMGK